MQPTLSVIMAVYNSLPYLDEAIRSVQQQTVTDWELLVVDDASTDGSAERAQALADADPRIRLIRLPENRGAGAARDVAIGEARGRFIAIADADDICMPERFEQQIRFLETHPDVVALGAQTLQINKDGTPAGRKTFPTDPDALYRMMYTAIPIQLPTLMVNKARLPPDFSWFEGWRYSEDSLLFFKLSHYGQLANLPDPLLRYRYYAQSTSYRHAKTYFWWTWKSRGIARRQYGYRPSLRARAISGVQCLVVSVMPNFMIPLVYKGIRRIMLRVLSNVL